MWNIAGRFSTDRAGAGSSGHPEAWEKGPPMEEVGLEPFATPEYLSGQAVRR